MLHVSTVSVSWTPADSGRHPAATVSTVTVSHTPQQCFWEKQTEIYEQLQLYLDCCTLVCHHTAASSNFTLREELHCLLRKMF